jgi:glycosyltransferase involved in cell wall biosynthesis
MKSENLSQLLTICIPTYNRSDALDSCLFSICSQIELELLQVKIIISDNNSNDQTEEIVEKWKNFNSNIEYHKNDKNIGAVKNFWKITQYVKTKYFWFLGDDSLAVPGSIKHIIEILSSDNETSLLILAGTNDISDQSEIIKKLYHQQGMIIKCEEKNEFISSFWLQTLGNISKLVFNTEKWKETNYQDQPPYFIYPQIRSVLEVCFGEGNIYFTNRLCVYGYSANENYNLYYINKAALSVVYEFPWLQNYAIKLGFNKRNSSGLHKKFIKWKIKQWIRILLLHPHYKSLYKAALESNNLWYERMILKLLIPIIIPFRNILKKIIIIKGYNNLEKDKINEYV